jgi:hypothetical protein
MTTSRFFDVSSLLLMHLPSKNVVIATTHIGGLVGLLKKIRAQFQKFFRMKHVQTVLKLRCEEWGLNGVSEIFC